MFNMCYIYFKLKKITKQNKTNKLLKYINKKLIIKNEYSFKKN